jgi:hypothetical protein
MRTIAWAAVAAMAIGWAWHTGLIAAMALIFRAGMSG